MSTEFKNMLSEIARAQAPSYRDLIAQRETAILAIRTFHNEAEHYLLQEKIARTSLAEINAKIKQLYGEVP